MHAIPKIGKKEIFMDKTFTYMPGAEQSLEKKEYWIESVQPRAGRFQRESRLYDLSCILQTVKLVFTHEGAR